MLLSPQNMNIGVLIVVMMKNPQVLALAEISVMEANIVICAEPVMKRTTECAIIVNRVMNTVLNPSQCLEGTRMEECMLAAETEKSLRITLNTKAFMPAPSVSIGTATLWTALPSVRSVGTEPLPL